MEYTVFRVLSKFSVNELKHFRKFINSPYFNNSSKLKDFYYRLNDFHPDYPEDTKILGSLISDEKDVNRSTLINLLHDLQCLAEKFISLRAFENNMPDSCSNITFEIRKGGHYEVLNKLIKKFDEEERLQGTNYLFSLIDFNDEKFNMLAETGRFTGKKRMHEMEHLVVRRDALLKMYISIENIKMWHLYSNIQKKYEAAGNSKTEFIDVEKILVSLLTESSVSDFHDLIKIYVDLHKFQTERLEFEEFKILVDNVIDKLHIDERNYLYGRLIDYTTVQSKINNKYEDIQLDLYIELFGKGYYKSSVCEHIPPDLWRVAVINGYKYKKIKWLEDLINNYSPHITPGLRQSLVIYTQALILYLKKDFYRVLELVNKVEFSMMSIKIDIRNIMLRCYYETGQFEAAISLLDSFAHIIDNTALPVELKKNYRSYMRIVNRLIAYRIEPLNRNYKKAKLTYMNLGNIPQKEWVDMKFSELKKPDRK